MNQKFSLLNGASDIASPVVRFNNVPSELGQIGEVFEILSFRRFSVPVGEEIWLSGLEDFFDG